MERRPLRPPGTPTPHLYNDVKMERHSLRPPDTPSFRKDGASPFRGRRGATDAIPGRRPAADRDLLPAHRLSSTRTAKIKKPRRRVPAGLLILARPEGFEPSALGFVVRYSIQLSYGRNTMNLLRYFERRERDLNPRYRLSPYTGLANQRLQPLGHLSIGLLPCNPVRQTSRRARPRPVRPSSTIKRAAAYSLARRARQALCRPSASSCGGGRIRTFGTPHGILRFSRPLP